MANYCPTCAQSVASDMRACPRCGTALPNLLHHASVATAPTGDPFRGSYRPPLETPPGQFGVGRDSYAADLMRPVATPYAKAPLGARFGAMLIDSLAPLIPLVVGILLLAAGGAGLGLADGSAAEVQNAFGGSALVGLVVLAVSVPWSIWYYFTKDAVDGSWGKRAVGLMVIHLPTDRPCTRGQSAIRAIVWAALGLVPLVGWLIEPLIAMIANDGRRLGDRASETMVITTAEYRARR